jgi:hypothetical protein
VNFINGILHRVSDNGCPSTNFSFQRFCFQLLPFRLPGAETIVRHSCPQFSPCFGQWLSKANHFIRMPDARVDNAWICDSATCIPNSVVYTGLEVSLQEARAKTPNGKKRETTHVFRCEMEIFRMKNG